MDFEKLKIDIESIKETLGSLRFSFAEDYYDAGYALGRAEGWNAALEEIERSENNEKNIFRRNDKDRHGRKTSWAYKS